MYRMPHAQRYADGEAAKWRSGEVAKWQERPTHTNSNQLTHGSVQPRRRTSSQPLLTVLQATSHAPCSALPIPDSRDASSTTHPVTRTTCNRLQTFREGMSTSFVAILSFSPAAATGTT
ncbi:hypothetical protein EYC55_05680 [Xanthomonas oryzae]|nr:hypothetical protein EYC55_05680 [Xanthomonas oryzae]